MCRRGEKVAVRAKECVDLLLEVPFSSRVFGEDVQAHLESCLVQIRAFGASLQVRAEHEQDDLRADERKTAKHPNEFTDLLGEGWRFESTPFADLLFDVLADKAHGLLSLSWKVPQHKTVHDSRRDIGYF